MKTRYLTFFYTVSVMILVMITVTTAFSANPKTLTWASLKAPGHPFAQTQNRKVVLVGTHLDSNPYSGDTDETTRHRLLCIVPSSALASNQRNSMPQVYANYFQQNFDGTGKASDNWKFYYGWNEGFIGLTKKIKGTSPYLASRQAADQFCKNQLNDPLAWALEHHDNGVDGWNVGANIHPNSKEKKQLKRAGRSLSQQPQNENRKF